MRDGRDFWEPLRGRLLADEAAQRFAERAVMGHSARFDAAARDRGLSLRSDLLDPELLEALLERCRRETEEALRADFLDEAFAVIHDIAPDMRERERELRRLFASERLDLMVAPPLGSRPSLAHLSLLISLGAIFAGLVTLGLFRTVFRANNEAALFWALIAGAPAGAYFVTQILSSLEDHECVTRSDELSPMRFAWAAYSGRLAGVRRALFFLPRLIVSALFKRTGRSVSVYDAAWHRVAIARAAEQWLWAASALLAGLAARLDEPAIEESPEFRDLTIKLGEKLLRLHKAEPEMRAPMITELLNTARSLGFDLPERAETTAVTTEAEILIWNDDLASRYRRYDHIDDGDRARIVEEPVQLNGVIHKKGLLRRHWGEGS